MSHLPRPPALPAAGLLALVVALGAGPAAAEPCAGLEGGLRQGPVSVTFLQGDLGAPRSACPTSAAGFGAQAGVVYEVEKYGLNPTVHVGAGSPIHASAQGRVFGSLRLTDRVEVFGSFQPVNYKTIISSLSASYLGLGDASAGATLLAFESGSLAVGVTGQVTLPTTIGLYRNAWPVGLDSGLVFAFEPVPFFQLHGQLSGVASVGVTPAAFDPRAGMLGVLGGELFFWDWVSLVVDLNALGLYNGSLAEPIDHLAVAGGLRAKIFAGLGAEALVLAPVLGRERSLARTRVALTYRF